MVTDERSVAGQVALLRDEMVETRRVLHRLPELGFQEVETAALIAARLRAIPGVEAIHERVGVTGVTALIRGGKPGPVLLLRADIDALPIHEATGAAYASIREGVMHACGHDGHTTILLAVAKILAARREEIAGSVFLVFQPAEELLNGAQTMLDDGLWDLGGGPVAATLGLHLANWLPLGQVGVRAGAFFAAVDRIQITITGRGGHGAMPHLAIDPVVTAAETVLALQRIVSREVSAHDPAVVSICQMQAGSAFNIIPEDALLVGTVRTFDARLRRSIGERIARVVHGVAAAGGARASLEMYEGPGSVVNDAAMCEVVRAVARPVVGADAVVEPLPTMGGDDVALFLERAPGCYFLVGSADPSRGFDAPHHHPRFDFAEEALPTAATVLAGAALRYLHAQ
jgi:amidohydrolase